VSHRLRFCTECPDHEACATGASCQDVTRHSWTEAAPLHLAAEHMRELHGPDHPRHTFWSTLASQLEEAATPRRMENAVHRFAMLNIANAYLEAL
jgi:hypothetical protein